MDPANIISTLVKLDGVTEANRRLAEYDKKSRVAAKGADTFTGSIHKASDEVRIHERIMGGLVSAWGVAAVALIGVGGVVDAVKHASDELKAQQKIAAQTQAVIKSTGDVSHVTAKQVDELAMSIQNKSGVDEKTIRSGENMLLTFRNIRNESGRGNDVFTQSTRALIDMSTALGTNAPQAAIRLGRALNDPVHGISALTRSGVQFTEAQKKQIKAMVDSGNTMGAQKMILAELNKEFGGSANAMGKTLPGQINILKEHFDELAGSILGKAAPAFTFIITKVNDFITGISSGKGVGGAFSGAISTGFNTAKGVVVDFINEVKTGTGIGGQFAAFFEHAFSTIQIVIAAVIPIVTKFVKQFETGRGVGGLFQKVLLTIWTIIQRLWILLKAVVNIFNLWILDLIHGRTYAVIIAGAIAGIVAALIVYNTYLLAVRTALAIATAAQIVFNAVVAINPFVLILIGIGALVGALIAAYEKVAWFRNAVNVVWRDIRAVAEAVFPVIKKIVTNVFDGIKNYIGGVLNVIRGIVNVFAGLFTGDWDRMWKGIKQIFSGAAQAVLGYLQAITGPMRAVGAAIMDALKGGINDAWKAVKNFVGSIADSIVGVIKGIWNAMYDTGKFILNAIGSGIKAAWHGVVGIVQDFLNALLSPINLVLGVINVKPIKVKFAEGGIFSGQGEGFARGGMVKRPGYFAGEEAPAHPEVILATNPAYRKRNLDLFAKAGHMLGVPGYQAGGVVGEVEGLAQAAGFNKVATAGILGNAQQESTMNPNTAGGGLWQQVSNFGIGTGGTVLNQWQVMLPQIIGLRAAMNAATSPGQAADIFEMGFEKAGIPALANREKYATQFYQQLTGSSGSSLLGGVLSAVGGFLGGLLPSLPSLPKGIPGFVKDILEFPLNAAKKAVESVFGGLFSGGGQSIGSAAYAGLRHERIDQGLDFGGSGPVRSVLGGSVLRNTIWPGWPGTGGIVYSTPRGNVYVMEDFKATAAVGELLKQGQIIGIATGGSTGIETGWANAAGTGPLTPYNGAPDGTPMPGGISFNKFLGFRKGGVYAGAYGQGGIVNATSPTMAVFGEHGPETAMFIPHFATGGVSGLGSSLTGGLSKLTGVSSAGASGGGGGATVDWRTALGIPALPSIGGVAGSTPTAASSIEGKITGLNDTLAGLQQQLTVSDSIFNISSIQLLDSSGNLNVAAINDAATKAQALIDISSQIFDIYSQIVVWSQRLAETYTNIIQRYQTEQTNADKLVQNFKAALSKISLAHLKGNALTAAKRRQTDLRSAITSWSTYAKNAGTNVTKYSGLQSTLLGNITSAMGNRDSAWIDEQQRIALKTSVLGTQPTASAAAAATAGATSAGATSTTAPTAADAALQQLLLQSQQMYNVSQAQYSVLQGLPPFGGSFAGGGVVPGAVGAPRTVIAHGGETIGGPMQIQVIVHDGAVDPNKIEVIATNAAVRVTRGQSRTGTQSGLLPGARR